jgi:hypothetical protein
LRRTSRKPGKITSSASGTEAPASDADAITAVGDASLFSTSDLSLHELFEQQARNMLERADIDEEQRQSILVAMACPCCGAGGMSFSVRLKADEL